VCVVDNASPSSNSSPHQKIWYASEQRNSEIVMHAPKEDPSLKLLEPLPEEQLFAWLEEFYGKRVEISQRELLRHRDLSYVERLVFRDSLPNSLIYKLVLPPWDIEQDLHERVLIPSISNSAQLYLSGHSGSITALFLEDLGSNSLIGNSDGELATSLGKELAKMHRSYSYRTDELVQVGVLRCITPIDYAEFANNLANQLENWNLLLPGQRDQLAELSNAIALNLAGEPTSLVHGDFYAENIILRGDKLFIIDWSWFTILGVPLMDLATITMSHHKNGNFTEWRTEMIDAYCFEAGRESKDVLRLLPYAEALSRLFFLDWLVERKLRGIIGTTVGPVENLIPVVVRELAQYLTTLQS